MVATLWQWKYILGPCNDREFCLVNFDFRYWKTANNVTFYLMMLPFTECISEIIGLSNIELDEMHQRNYPSDIVWSTCNHLCFLCWCHTWKLHELILFSALCSNTYYREDAKELVFIMKIFIILSDKGPEFGRDDCWLFVFQYSFATWRLKLGENMLKIPVFSLMQSVSSIEESREYIFLKNVTTNVSEIMQQRLQERR